MNWRRGIHRFVLVVLGLFELFIAAGAVYVTHGWMTDEYGGAATGQALFAVEGIQICLLLGLGALAAYGLGRWVSWGLLGPPQRDCPPITPQNGPDLA
jgi:hypothetical protein